MSAIVSYAVWAVGSARTLELSPELRLAIACCRFPGGDDGSTSLARDSSKPLDWIRFLETIRRHRVQTLASKALGKAGISPPDPVAKEIAQDCATIARQNLCAARESLRLLDAFTAAGLPLLFVKGLTLSALAYGDAFLKPSSDVDILIDYGAVAEAQQILNGLGYRCVLPGDGTSQLLREWHLYSKESVWAGPSGAVWIDLHSRLVDQPSLLAGVGLSSPRQEVEIGGGRSLPTLTRADLFSYLCVHGASSAWFRLKWVADLAAIVAGGKAADMDPLYLHAEKLGARRAAAQGLLVARALSLIELPDAFEERLGVQQVHRRLASIALRQLLNQQEPGERFLGTTTIHASQLLLLGSLSMKLREARRQLLNIAAHRLNRFPFLPPRTFPGPVESSG